MPPENGHARRAARRKARLAGTVADQPARREPVSQPDPQLRVPRLGWLTIAAKEFADQLMSVRFLVLTIILGLAAAGAVRAMAGTIRDVAPSASGAHFIFLKMFTLSPGTVSQTAQDFPSFITLIGFLGPLLGIAFGFDGINGERAERTLPRLLAQPIHRDDVVNGKFVAGLATIGLIFAVVTGFVAAIGILLLGVIPQPEEILRLILWIIVAVVYVGFWLAFALACSVLLRRAATSALAAIAVWLALTLFASLLVGTVASFLAPPNPNDSAAQIANASLQQELARLSPGQLFTEATAAVLDPGVRTTGLVLPAQADRAVASLLSLDQSLLVIWPQIVALVAGTAIAFAVAYVGFMRQEVRA
jgi:ABC-2 type transport system permease protein